MKNFIFKHIIYKSLIIIEAKNKESAFNILEAITHNRFDWRLLNDNTGSLYLLKNIFKLND